MDIPLDVKVQCVDGECGKTTTIILNPVTTEVTHVVVKDRHQEYMVPLGQISESSADLLKLQLSREELAQQEPFIRTQFLGQEMLDQEYDAATVAAEMDTVMWPYNSLDDSYLEMYHQVEQIPHDELAIHRGAHVEASDGHIGRVDEFIVNPENNHVTHLVLLEGHLWGKKTVAIPISEIDRIEQDTVYLKLDKETLKSIPAVPTRR
ncbi:MAG: PRC-barrel domain-containing protein [Candidatus Promineifilaceae bacterium]